MIASGLEKVNAGRGPDTYRTIWLVEFNWVVALILLMVSVLALLGGLWFRHLDRLETRPLQAGNGPRAS
jgi:hypothetical protein